MPIRDILVHLDRRPGNTARLLAAVNLARRYSACLKGLCVISHPYYTPHTDLERDYGEVHRFFVNAASKSGVLAHWLYEEMGVVGAPGSDLIVRHSYTTDLVIIGQHGTAGDPERDLPERLILGCGRPVVIFPTESTAFQFGTKILIAWKEGRESSRVLHEAMPLLKGAESVHVLSVVSGDEERNREQAGLDALQEHLSRHGMDTLWTVVERGKRSVADIILEQAAEKEIDLLVMGGCSYDWKRTPVFNALGREIMQRSAIPVLFAH